MSSLNGERNVIVTQKTDDISNQSKPLFSKMIEFCSSLQTQYQDIIYQFELSPGSNPFNYDRGLKALKSEIAYIKKTTEDTEEDVYKIRQFGYFVESTKDLINHQKKDLVHMEKFLMRYGYIPPEALDENREDIIEENNKLIDEKIEDELIKSPELSEIGKKLIKEKGLRNMSKFSAFEKPLNVNKERVITTPIQSKNSKWYMTPTPHMSSRKKIEKWIESVEAAAAFMTPMYKKSVKSSLNFDDEDENLSDINQKVLNRIKNEQKPTPEAPIISTVTTLALKDNSSITPEEPVISNTDSSFGKKFNPFQNTTPEEPDLYSQSDRVQTEEASSKFLPSSHQPSSPQLSDITQKVLNLKNTVNYDHKSLGKIPDNSPKINTSSQNIEPESPQLSDLTLKILRKHF